MEQSHGPEPDSAANSKLKKTLELFSKQLHRLDLESKGASLDAPPWKKKQLDDPRGVEGVP